MSVSRRCDCCDAPMGEYDAGEITVVLRAKGIDLVVRVVPRNGETPNVRPECLRVLTSKNVDVRKPNLFDLPTLPLSRHPHSLALSDLPLLLLGLLRPVYEVDHPHLAHTALLLRLFLPRMLCLDIEIALLGNYCRNALFNCCSSAITETIISAKVMVACI